MEGRAKGLILVLVIDQAQMDDPPATIARVCRDYDVGDVEELAADLSLAAKQATNQVRLHAAMRGVLARAARACSPSSAPRLTIALARRERPRA